MLIRIEQLNPIIGDLSGNTKLILQALEKAELDNVGLLILPEMVVTGYPAQDLLENDSFRDACYDYNGRIISHSKNCAILFGSIIPNESGPGRKMYNSAILAKYGKQLGVACKTLLPTYDVFDDLRYFEPNHDFKCLDLDGLQLGVTICEDIWYNQNEVQYHTYSVDPARILKQKGAQIIINISASPYTKSKHENREKMLRNHARKLGLPMLYSNQVGAHTEIIFDGDSMAVSGSAEVIARTEPFQPSFVDVSWNQNICDIRPVTGQKLSVVYPQSGPERQFEAIRTGLRDYLEKTGISEKVILGLSGGIDSALVCVLAAETLGPDNVVAVTMPGEFSSQGSIEDSVKLAANLGVGLHQIGIQQTFDELENSLSPFFEGHPFDVAEENLQSRIRGTILMALANKFNYFLLATGNKSEYAVGYATLYGDMNGALAIIGDLYKTEVYGMCEWLNRDYYQKEIIPAAIIKKAPSAELRPDQKDSDSLPEYDVLDNILYRYIELQENPGRIISGGYPAEIVEKVIRLVDLNEFKRYQAAPILKLSSKSFGSGRRWPIVQRWTSNNKK
ncbi:MAG: NAD+ synthase [Balneolaceae bacterium]|nr:MAG: NAD+ synthase [Balneolaceae bacterium]